MNYLIWVLRLIHIVGGVFWLGSAFTMFFFVGPAVQATGESGLKVVQHMMTKAQVSQRIMAASILTVLSGGWLYWIDSDGFSSAWTRSGAGWGFGIGGLLALIGLAFGMQVGRNNRALAGLAGSLQGPPTQEQREKMAAIQKRADGLSRISSAALLLSLVCMATARYWGL
jgi:uncharacterized membrane protein